MNAFSSSGCFSLFRGQKVGKSREKEKAARELRQGKSDYRCCLPALAGFVCLQSVVPDGGPNMRKAGRKTNVLFVKN
jgi:hypothetical protein